jgi:hypothetical protein
MSIRDQLPEVLNEIARHYGKESHFEETQPIWLLREAEWDSCPRQGDQVRIVDIADLRFVEEIQWGSSGVPTVILEDFDTDEIGDEGAALELLLALGWEVDLSFLS